MELPQGTELYLLLDFIMPALCLLSIAWGLHLLNLEVEKKGSVKKFINHKIKNQDNVISGVSNYRPPIYHNIHSRKSTVKRRDRLKSSA